MSKIKEMFEAMINDPDFKNNPMFKESEKYGEALDELLPLAKAISYQECEAVEKMKEEVENAAKVSVPFDRRRDVIIAIADPSMSADDIIGKYFKKDMTDEQHKRVADHIEKVRVEHAESLRRIHEDYRGN